MRRPGEVCRLLRISSTTLRQFCELAEHPAVKNPNPRALDNIFVERLWRSVKYEEVYPRQYQSLREAHAGLAAYFRFYNTERPHPSLANRTPADVYDNSQPLQRAA